MADTDSNYMLTTYDNPFNPFTNFELWFKQDMLLGYNTCSLIEKFTNVNEIQSLEINLKDLDDAIELIIKQNPTIYKKVYKDDF